MDAHKKYYRMLEIYKRIHQHLVIKEQTQVSFNFYLISDLAISKPETISVKREPPDIMICLLSNKRRI